MVGASARAAVGSLLRAGFDAWAVDLFADRDLRRMAPCVRCPLGGYPAALPARCDPFPPGPVLYTGGLENYPDVVRELARRRPLWGNGPDVLDRVRDPFRLSTRIMSRGFDSPHLSPPGRVPPGGRWLIKRRGSSGGLGVRFAKPGEAAGPDSYLQEFIDGPSISALYASSAGEVVLLGVTSQLVGEVWLHARPFAYCGNVGPAETSSGLRKTLSELGDLIGRGADLRGVWGVDFVLRDGHPLPVDVNPRYPAGTEVLEHGYHFAALAHHTTALAGHGPLGGPTRRIAAVVGKAVYYAPRRLTFPAAGPWDAEFAAPFDPWRLPAFADIPDAGNVLEAGSPVLTVFATGSSAAECRRRLQSRAAELDALLG